MLCAKSQQSKVEEKENSFVGKEGKETVRGETRIKDEEKEKIKKKLYRLVLTSGKADGSFSLQREVIGFLS